MDLKSPRGQIKVAIRGGFENALAQYSSYSSLPHLLYFS